MGAPRQAYGTLCRELRAADGATTTEALAVVTNGLGRWVPSDQDFEDALATVAPRGRFTSWRLVLETLNRRAADEELDLSNPKRVHIEHVLPQSPSKQCLQESGLTEAEGSELTHRLGNLTLLSGTKNVSLSNGAFLKKRGALTTSQIALNRWFADKARWGRKEIEERQTALAHLALEEWAWPIDSSLSKKGGTRGRTKAAAKPNKRASSSSRHEPTQPTLPGTTDTKPDVDRLDPTLVYEGTVWIPRLLWALNAASLRALGPVRASGLARILEAELEQTIQGTNTARAFRDLRDHKAASTWWTETPRGYVITDAGRATLRTMLEGRKRPRRAAKPKLASTRPAAVIVVPAKRKARGAR